MRSFLKIVSAAGLAMALAAGAQAGEFTGSVSFGLSTLPPLVASGPGSGVSTVGTPPANLITLPATPPFAAVFSNITLDPTAAPPLKSLDIALTAPVNCSFTGSPIGGACALGGTANALLAPGADPLLVVPLGGMGVAGRQIFGPYGSYIDAQSWVAATATATVNGNPITEDGVPFTTVGYDNRTPGGQGFVKLVAPGGLMSTLTSGDLPLFVSMTLEFVPEPGTPLLLVSGIAGAVVLGRRRMRS